MARVVVEFAGRRTETLLNGRLSIGRTRGSGVVINHPTVSRTHACIEQDGGGYVIVDTGSRNGTTIGAEPITDRRALCDGEIIQIGPAKLTFVAEADVSGASSTDGNDDPSNATAVLFPCACGARLWVPASAAGRKVRCRTCNAVVSSPPPPRTQTQNTVCSICQWKLGPGDQTTACPECGLTFHAECWSENRGCSAYGCGKVNALDPKAEEAPPPLAEEIGHPPDLSMSTRRGLPVAYLLLGLGAFGVVIGAALWIWLS